MEAIRICGLCKQYRDVRAVDDFSLSVEKGELFSLLGVNGAGKTTLIRMLCCLTPPTAGEAWVGGNSILTQSAAVKSCIAVAPQETAVAPNLTARENLALMAGVHGFSVAETARLTDELTQQFGLAEILSRRAGKLSGGWQRRLSIAMALISRPDILFLDEPTLGLDVLARMELWDIIRSLKGKITVVMTTHYMEEADALSDRIAIMKSGRLLLTDTPDGIRQKAGTDKFEEAFVRIVKGDVL